ncbi:MAG: hypothetical protein QME92_10995 [Bacillota bacterium]|nr:hypothetical protein [Bacillota bacterium]
MRASERGSKMALRAGFLRALTCGLLVAGCIALCLGLTLLVSIREQRHAPLDARGTPGGAWGEATLRASCGSVTITAPSREAVHTTVNHSLGRVPVAVVLGLDLQEFDYYESIDSRSESGGPPTEVPVHLSAMVRKPYNGTFTIRLKHFAGSPRTFTVRWLAIALDRLAAAAAPTVVAEPRPGGSTAAQPSLLILLCQI